MKTVKWQFRLNGPEGELEGVAPEYPKAGERWSVKLYLKNSKFIDKLFEPNVGETGFGWFKSIDGIIYSCGHIIHPKCRIDEQGEILVRHYFPTSGER